jgi:hypothetical protein
MFKLDLIHLGQRFKGCSSIFFGSRRVLFKLLVLRRLRSSSDKKGKNECSYISMLERFGMIAYKYCYIVDQIHHLKKLHLHNNS